MIVSLLIAILIMGTDSAQSFFFAEQKKGGKNKQKILISAILQWRLLSGAIIIIMATALTPLINKYLFNSDLTIFIFIVAFSQAIFATLMSQSIEVLRLLFKPWPYVFLNFLLSVISASLIIFLVTLFDLGILGYFLGTTVSSLILCLIGWFTVRDYINFQKIHYEWWPRLLKFGLPLLPTGIAFYLMSSMDRWFIQYYHGSEVLGIYAVGAKFAMLVAIIVETFRQAWWPIAMDSIHSIDGPETLRMISRLYIGLGVPAIIILALLSEYLVTLFTPAIYYSAWPIVSILAWQSFFYGFYMIGSIGIWKSEKTFYSMFLMGGATAINLILNLLLVPKYAAIGASVSTVISFLFWIISAVIVSEYLWRIRHQFYLIIFQVLIGMIIVSIIVLDLLPRNSFFEISAITLSIIMAIYAFQKEHRRKIQNYIKHFFTQRFQND